MPKGVYKKTKEQRETMGFARWKWYNNLTDEEKEAFRQKIIRGKKKARETRKHK